MGALHCGESELVAGAEVNELQVYALTCDTCMTVDGLYHWLRGLWEEIWGT